MLHGRWRNSFTTHVGPCGPFLRKHQEGMGTKLAKALLGPSPWRHGLWGGLVLSFSTGCWIDVRVGLITKALQKNLSFELEGEDFLVPWFAKMKPVIQGTWTVIVVTDAEAECESWLIGKTLIQGRLRAEETGLTRIWLDSIIHSMNMTPWANSGDSKHREAWHAAVVQTRLRTNSVLGLLTAPSWGERTEPWCASWGPSLLLEGSVDVKKTTAQRQKQGTQCDKQRGKHGYFLVAANPQGDTVWKGTTGETWTKIRAASVPPSQL